MTRAALLVTLLLTPWLALTAHAADQPGQRFQILPADLPKPVATPVVVNNPVRIARAGQIPAAPPGFKVTLFADGLANPRFLAVAPNGDVLLTERLSGRITLLRDSNGDGHADQRFTYVEGLRNPSGIVVAGGYVYIGDQNAIWRTPYVAGANQAGRLERVTTASDPWMVAMHGPRSLAVNADGSLFVAMGSRDTADDTQPLAKIFQVRDGALVDYAAGLRNPVGIAFNPGTNDLFAAVIERNGLGANLPPDYFTYVRPGGFYGYPYAYAGKNPDPELGGKRPDLVEKSITPDVLLPAHSAPSGMVFYAGAMFPSAYKGDVFVALHGSGSASEPRGYKVVRIHMKNGRVDGHGFENFLTGFWDGLSRTPPQVWGRPVSLAVGRDGALLVSDDMGNAIWRVAYGK